MIHIEATAAFGKKKERHMRESEVRAPHRRRKDASPTSPASLPAAPSSPLVSASATSLTVRPSAFTRTCARRSRPMRHESEDRAARASPLGQPAASASEEANPLVLALFCDGFVCRHYTAENECVEGFAQPYDAESGYFLECIRHGQIPDGLTDVIAIKSRSKQIQAEIHDFRAAAVACPASSADLPAVHDTTLRCESWNVLLRPASPVRKIKMPEPLINPFPTEVNDKQWDMVSDDGDKQLLEIVFPVADGVPDNASKADSLRQPLPLPHISRSINSRLPASDSRSQSAAHLARSSGFGKGSDSKNHRATSHRRNADGGRGGTVSTKKENRSGNAMKAQAAIPHAGSALKWNKLVPPSTPRRRAKGSPRQSELLQRRSGKHDRRQHCGHASVRGRSSSDNSANSYASMPPLPATQLFLSKLKRKRPRVVSTELHYGKPAWVTINHIGLFFHAATQFERHYAHSLHSNVDRLMKGESSSDAGDQKMDVGSMGHLAQSLQPMAWPTQVIANAGRKRHRADDGDHHQSAVASAQYDSIVGAAQEYPIARAQTAALPRQAIALPPLVGPPSDLEDVELLYLL